VGSVARAPRVIGRRLRECDPRRQRRQLFVLAPWWPERSSESANPLLQIGRGEPEQGGASVPDLALLDSRHAQRALLAGADQHLPKELAFRRVNERVGSKGGRQVRQRTPGREKNAGADDGETVLFELSDHRADGADRQQRGTIATLSNQCFRPLDTQPLSRMIGLPGARNRGIGGLDSASVEDNRAAR